MKAASIARRLARATAAGEIVADDAQVQAAIALDQIREELQRASGQTRWRRLAGALGFTTSHEPVRGLYLWGAVGRGKTFLLDLFFESLSVEGGLREHFYRFMRDVHLRLTALGPCREPLDAVAAALADRHRVICLDEFFVADIGDAMILAGLLQGLFSRGVTLVTTSNVAPVDLYKDGLQRQRFLPVIDLIQRHLDTFELHGAQDHRLRHLERSGTYLTAAPDWRERMQAIFTHLAGQGKTQPSALMINARPIAVQARSAEVVWFDFAALCGSARGAADYIDIAQSFHTVLLSQIPILDETQENAARRFITLIDEFYDRRVKLIVAAAAAPAALYAGERLRFEFERTVSRLIEMQSLAYLAQPHLVS